MGGRTPMKALDRLDPCESCHAPLRKPGALQPHCRPRSALCRGRRGTGAGGGVLSCALRVARRLPAGRERAHHVCPRALGVDGPLRSEEHTSELQSLMRISYAVFCLKKKNTKKRKQNISTTIT